MGKSTSLILGIVALGAGAYFLNKRATISSIGAKWGTNGTTGSQTVLYGTTQKLSIHAVNPTTKAWAYNIVWKVNGGIGASWSNVVIPAGGAVDLAWNVIFGPYRPGDVLLTGQYTQMNVDMINGMISYQQTNGANGIIPNMAGDFNQDGVINTLDASAMSASLINPNFPPVNNLISSTGVYTSEFVVTETSSGAVLHVPSDTITVVTIGTLSINSTPSGASIWIDNVDTGFVTPQNYVQLLSGSHNLILKLSGYDNYIQLFDIDLNNSINCTLIQSTIPSVYSKSFITNINYMFAYNGSNNTAYQAFYNISSYIRYLLIQDFTGGQYIIYQNNILVDNTFILRSGYRCNLIVNQSCVWNYN